MNNKPYLVYLNKSYDCNGSDAYWWAKNNNYKSSDFKEIISEVAFHIYIEKGIMDNTPIFFVKDKYDFKTGKLK